jgi:hypothetical protein
VFGIEIEQCARCGGRLEVIASIEEPELIERILAHRRERGGGAMTVSLGARAPPQASPAVAEVVVPVFCSCYPHALRPRSLMAARV